jgi:predicted nucleic acid-binding protein
MSAEEESLGAQPLRLDGGQDLPQGVEFLDSDVICRYLVNDHVELSPRSAQLIDSHRRLRISILTLAEVAHVLRSFYGRTPEQIADALIQLLERENIATHELDTDLAIEALDMTRPSRRISVPDALLWAIAQTSAPARVWSFDRRFPSDGLDLAAP